MAIDWDSLPEALMEQEFVPEAMDIRRELIIFIMGGDLRGASSEALGAALYTLWMTVVESNEVCLACVFEGASSVAEHTCSVN